MYKIEEILNTIIQGNSLEVLKKIPTESISLICCSSPYWGLRDYMGESIIWDGLEDCEHEWGESMGNISRLESPGVGAKQEMNASIGNFCQVPTKLGRDGNTQGNYKNGIDKSKAYANTKPPGESIKCGCGAWKGQLGLEPDFNMFIDHLLQIFDECNRVLRKDGALWVNLGDTYYGGGNASGHTDESANFGVSTLKRGMVTKPVARGNQLKNKTLVGIPDRFKIAMIDNGWICRNEIIWHKPNAMPSSVKDRFTVDFEKFFFFVKNRQYYFEQQFNPISEATIKRDQYDYNNPFSGQKAGVFPGEKRWKDGRFIPKGSFVKYKNLDEETKHRQGMNKDRGNAMIRKRNLPDQKDFVDYIRSGIWYDIDKDLSILSNKIKVGWICKDLNLEESKVEHWFRYDDSGYAPPSIEDWLKFQEFYDTDEFNELVEYWEEPDSIKSYSTKLQDAYKGHAPTNYYRMGEDQLLGRNKRTTWSIPTKPFPGAHFAVFPEELILPIIKSCVPKDGIVLDCFMGAGTTAIVSANQKKNWVGIELNPEYIEMSMKRINLNNKRLAKLENIKHQQNRI